MDLEAADFEIVVESRFIRAGFSTAAASFANLAMGIPWLYGMSAR